MHMKCKCSRLKEQCGCMHMNKKQWGRDIARREECQLNLQERVFVSLPGIFTHLFVEECKSLEATT